MAIATATLPTGIAVAFLVLALFLSPRAATAFALRPTAIEQNVISTSPWSIRRHQVEEKGHSSLLLKGVCIRAGQKPLCASIDKEERTTVPLTLYSPPTWTDEPVDAFSSSPPAEAVEALHSLAATILALLSGNEEAARSLMGGADLKRGIVQSVFSAYDVCDSGTLSVEEARALFVDLARSIVVELANPPSSPSAFIGGEEEVGNDAKWTRRMKSATAARAHAIRVLEADEAGNTIDRVARKLLLLSDLDGDGRINLQNLAGLFETVHEAGKEGYSCSTSVVKRSQEGRDEEASHVSVFPQPLRALAGSLQLLPPTERAAASEAAGRSSPFNIGVPGDDHTLRQVVLENGGGDKLTLIGLGRSADASAYFLPELGIALDAGLHVKSIRAKTILLTHGHRDHIACLPVHAQLGAKILVPKKIHHLVKRFLLAEAQLNYGDPDQTDEQTIAALGEFDIEAVGDKTKFLLPRTCYTGSPTPLSVEVFEAPHKMGVPAVSYGIYRSKTRLREEYKSLPKSELGALIRDDVPITESYEEGLIFYTGDTQIDLLKDRWRDILPKYKRVIHEVTFLGPSSSKLDGDVMHKGHTHYAQLHPWICAFPETTFICVHWSLRYSKEDILDFFKEHYGGVPKNVVLWI